MVYGPWFAACEKVVAIMLKCSCGVVKRVLDHEQVC
jgi:hypothetical protein